MPGCCAAARIALAGTAARASVWMAASKASDATAGAMVGKATSTSPARAAAARPPRAGGRDEAGPHRRGRPRDDRSSSLALQSAAQERAAPKELDADRRGGSAGDVRDLVDAQLVEVAEDDDHAIEIGQLPYGRADPRAILACHRLRVRRGIRVGNGRRLVDLDAAP